MSLAVQNVSSTRSSAIAVDAARDRRPAPARVGDDGGDRAAPNSRRALLGAVVDAVRSLFPDSAAVADAQRADGHASKHALHGFVHALLAELRPAAGEGGHGRGFAWGRTSAATIGERLDDLVARLQAGSATPPPQAAANDDATAAATTASSPSPSPSPASPPSALLTAFRELATARGAGEAGGSATSDALIALLKRVAGALGADAGALAPAAGGVLDAVA